MGDGHSWTAPLRSAPRPRPSAGTAFVALGAGQGRGTHPKAGMAARAHASTARDVAIVSKKNRGGLRSHSAGAAQRKLSEKSRPCFVRCRWGKLRPAFRWEVGVCTLDHGTYRGTWPPTCIACQRDSAVTASARGCRSYWHPTLLRHSATPSEVGARRPILLGFGKHVRTCQKCQKKSWRCFLWAATANRPHIALLTCRALPS